MSQQRIIILDDDLDYAMNMGAALEETGAFVELAHTVDEAKKLLADNLPAVFVIRAELKRASSFAFVADIRRSPETEALNVVMVSTEEDQTIVDWHRSGSTPANAYVVPPVEMGRLLAVVRQFLWQESQKSESMDEDPESGVSKDELPAEDSSGSEGESPDTASDLISDADIPEAVIKDKEDSETIMDSGTEAEAVNRENNTVETVSSTSLDGEEMPVESEGEKSASDDNLNIAKEADDKDSPKISDSEEKFSLETEKAETDHSVEKDVEDKEKTEISTNNMSEDAVSTGSPVDSSNEDLKMDQDSKESHPAEEKKPVDSEPDKSAKIAEIKVEQESKQDESLFKDNETEGKEEEKKPVLEGFGFEDIRLALKQEIGKIDPEKKASEDSGSLKSGDKGKLSLSLPDINTFSDEPVEKKDLRDAPDEISLVQGFFERPFSGSEGDAVIADARKLFTENFSGSAPEVPSEVLEAVRGKTSGKGNRHLRIRVPEITGGGKESGVGALERFFKPVLSRKKELLDESRRKSSEVKPRTLRRRGGLVANPEEKFEALREEIRERDIALAEIHDAWEKRDREISLQDERLHMKELEAEGLRSLLEDMMDRLNQARSIMEKKEKEGSDSISKLIEHKEVNEQAYLAEISRQEKNVTKLQDRIAVLNDEIARLTGSLDKTRLELNDLRKRHDESLENHEAYRNENEIRLVNRESGAAILEHSLESVRDNMDAALGYADARELYLIQKSKEIESSLHKVSMEQETNIRELSLLLAREKSLSDWHFTCYYEARKWADQREKELIALLCEVEMLTDDLDKERRDLLNQRNGIAQYLGSGIEKRDEEISRLEESLQKFQQEARKKETELEETLQSQKDRAENLVEELENVRRESSETKESLQWELGVVQNDFAALKDEHVRLQGEKAERETELNRNLSEASERIGELEGEIAALDIEKNELNEAFSAASESLEESSRKIEELGAEIEELGQARIGLEEELESARIESSARGERIAELENELSALGETRERLDGELENARNESASRSERVAELENELSQLRETRERLEGELESALNESSTRNERIAELENDLSSLNETRERLEGELESARNESSTKGERIEELENELFLLKEAKAGLEEQIENSNSETVQLLENIEKLEREVSSLSEARSGLEKEVETARNDIEQGRELIAELEREISDIREKKEDLEEALEAGRVENEGLAGRISDLENSLGTLEHEKAEKINEIEALEAKIEDISSIRESLAAENESLIVDHEFALNEIREELSEKNEEVSRLTAEMENLKNQYREESENLYKQVQEKEEEILNKSQSFAMLEADLHGRRQAAENDADEKAREITRLQSLLQDAMRTNVRQTRDHAAAIDEASRRVKLLEETLASENAKKDELEAELEKAGASIEKEKESREKEIARLESELDNARRKMEGYERDLKAANESSGSIREELVSRIEELEKERARSDMQRKETIEKARSFIDQAKAQIGVHKERAQAADQRLEESSQAHSRAEKAAKARFDAYEKNIAEARTRLESAISENRAIKARLSRVAQDVREQVKKEMAGREAQAVQEINRLQGIIKEKSTALRVAQLDNERLKSKINTANAGPRSGRSPSTGSFNQHSGGEIIQGTQPRLQRKAGSFSQNTGNDSLNRPEGGRSPRSGAFSALKSGEAKGRAPGGGGAVAGFRGGRHEQSQYPREGNYDVTRVEDPFARHMSSPESVLEDLGEKGGSSGYSGSFGRLDTNDDYEKELEKALKGLDD